MSDQKTEYERQAAEYEETAKRVTDPRMRENYLTLARYCREKKRVPRREDSRSPDRPASEPSGSRMIRGGAVEA